jgi:hypothetical protein
MTLSLETGYFSSLPHEASATVARTAIASERFIQASSLWRECVRQQPGKRNRLLS